MEFKGKYMLSGPDNLKLPFSALGAALHPGRDQLLEMNTDINWGVKNIELQLLSPQIVEKMPKWYYDEMARLAKLTGVKPSVHAPVVNLAGYSRLIDGYSEATRIGEEQRLKQMVDIAYKVGGPNTPVNVHASEMVVDEIGTPERTEVKGYVRKDVGRFYPVRAEEGKSTEDVVREAKQMILTQEIQRLGDLEHSKKIFEGMLREALGPLFDKYKDDLLRGHLSGELKESIHRDVRLAKEYAHVASTLQRIEEQLNDQVDKVKRLVESYVPEVRKAGGVDKFLDKIKKEYGSYEKYIEEQAKKHYAHLKDKNPEKYKEMVERDKRLLRGRLLRLGVVYPEDTSDIIVPAVDYEREKASETIAESAYYGYEKYGKKSPVVVVENPYPFIVGGRLEDLSKLVDEARKRFADKLVKDKKLSKEEAQKLAKDLIGVTLDVGHINLLKRYGYTDEQIKKEMEKILPKVKHVHLTDNFGYEDSHLVPGWGNANIKEALEMLEKKGYKGRMILETGGTEELWESSKGVSPHPFGPSVSYLSAAPSESWTDFGSILDVAYQETPPPRGSLYSGYLETGYLSFSGVEPVFGAYTGKKQGFSGAPMS